MSEYTFTPPTRTSVPAVAADTPSWQQKPAKWTAAAALIPRGVNVYKLLDGTYTEKQPTSNVAFTSGWEQVAVFYQGGAANPVDLDEATALTAAGYGPYIHPGVDTYPDTYHGSYT